MNVNEISAIVAKELRDSRVGFVGLVTPETRLYDDLHCCSLDMTCIQVEIEMQIGRDLPSMEVERCQTVADLARVVERVTA